MRRRVSVLQTLRRHMCVDLRGRKVRVPQKFLNAPEVRAPVQHMRRKRMAERVGRDLFSKPRPLLPQPGDG